MRAELPRNKPLLLDDVTHARLSAIATETGVHPLEILRRLVAVASQGNGPEMVLKLGVKGRA